MLWQTRPFNVISHLSGATLIKQCVKLASFQTSQSPFIKGRLITKYFLDILYHLHLYLHHLHNGHPLHDDDEDDHHERDAPILLHRHLAPATARRQHRVQVKVTLVITVMVMVIKLFSFKSDTIHFILTLTKECDSDTKIQSLRLSRKNVISYCASKAVS